MAVKANHKISNISWEDEKGEYDYCYYDSKKVEEYIEEGKWVVIN